MAGFSGSLIRSGGNAKTVKGDKMTEYETAIMYLAPFTNAGVGNVCPFAEKAGCTKACLYTAGRAGMFSQINEARVRKTRFYREDKTGFLATLVADIERFTRWCDKRGKLPAVRLNGTSDIAWERGHPVVRNGQRFPSIMAAFPEVQFYDYTKVYTRVDKELPPNYSLTLSYSGADWSYAEQVNLRAEQGKANLAVVYRTKQLAHDAVAWKGAVDGDQHDARFLDPQGGRIVALYAKGAAKRDTTGFVVG